MAVMGWIAHTETVVAPDDRVWTVRRVLLPRPPRWIGKNRSSEDRDSDWVDAISGTIDFGSALDGAVDGPTALVAGIVVFFVLLIGWAFLVPALFFLFDLLIVLLITLIGGAVRVLFKRPWKIEARTGALIAEQYSWGVVGVRRSADAVDSVAFAIQRGEPPDQIRLDR